MTPNSLTPLNGHVVVELIHEPMKTASGIILNKKQSNLLQGIIISDNHTTHKQNNHVLIQNHLTTPIDKDHLVVPTNSILGTYLK